MVLARLEARYPMEDLEVFWLGLWIKRGSPRWQKKIAGLSVY